MNFPSLPNSGAKGYQSIDCANDANDVGPSLSARDSDEQVLSFPKTSKLSIASFAFGFLALAGFLSLRGNPQGANILLKSTAVAVLPGAGESLSRAYHGQAHLSREVDSLSSQPFLPVVVGQKFQAARSKKDLFRGFKINVPSGGNPFMGDVFTGDYAVEPWAHVFTRSRVIRSQSDLDTMMEISGELSVSYGPMIEGSGQGSFLEHSISSTNKVTVMYVSRRTAFALVSTDHKPVEEVEQLLAGNPNDIYDKYGTLFVDQVQYGGQLDVTYIVSSESEISQQEIEAELRGSIGNGVLSIEFEAKFERQDGQERAEYQMEIEVKASGVNLDVPSNPSFRDVTHIIDDFNERYQALIDIIASSDDIENEPVAQQMTPVGLALDNISSYLPQLDTLRAAYLMSAMSMLKITLQDTLFKQAQLSREESTINRRAASSPSMGFYIVFYINPWVAARDLAWAELQVKLDECLDFRGKSVDEIFDGKLQAPGRVDQATRSVLSGLLGEGFQWIAEFGGKTFIDMYYSGYTIDALPFYMGSVRCHETHRLVDGPDYLTQMAPRINTDACKETPPETPPSPPPSSHPTNRPTPGCIRSGTTCSWDDDAAGIATCRSRCCSQRFEKKCHYRDCILDCK